MKWDGLKPHVVRKAVCFYQMSIVDARSLGIWRVSGQEYDAQLGETGAFCGPHHAESERGEEVRGGPNLVFALAGKGKVLPDQA